MTEALRTIVETKWMSKKFFLTLLSFAVFTVLLWFAKLNQDNYLLLAGGVVGAYLGFNVTQHAVYQRNSNANPPA